MPEFGGKYNKLGYDGVIFMGTEGWITDANGFGAHDREIWRTKFKDGDEDFAPSTEHCRNFIECVKTRNRPTSDVEQGHYSTMLCHLANISYRVGNRKLSFNPASESFTSVEANRFLRREYRAPWVLPETV